MTKRRYREAFVDFKEVANTRKNAKCGECKAPIGERAWEARSGKTGVLFKAVCSQECADASNEYLLTLRRYRREAGELEKAHQLLRNCEACERRTLTRPINWPGEITGTLHYICYECRRYAELADEVIQTLHEDL